MPTCLNVLINKMPRFLSNISNFRNKITISYKAGTSISDILSYINQNGCYCTFRTLEGAPGAVSLVRTNGRQYGR